MKPRRGGIVATIVLAIGAVIWISPLVLLLITGFRPLADFLANGDVIATSERGGIMHLERLPAGGGAQAGDGVGHERRARGREGS